MTLPYPAAGQAAPVGADGAMPGGAQPQPGDTALTFMPRAIEARLRTVFTTAFDFALLPSGKLSKAKWQAVVRRVPMLGLGYLGCKPAEDNGRSFRAHALWELLLVTRGVTPQQSLLGDVAAPGILSMIRAATVALQGYTIAPEGAPACASGSVAISSVDLALSDEFFGDDYCAASVILSVPYRETSAGMTLSQPTVGELMAIAESWSFAGGSGDAATDTIQWGAT